MNSPRRIALVAILAALLAAPPAFAVSETLRAIEQDFIDLGAQIRPSVVNIEVTSHVARRGMRMQPDDMEEFFRRFFGNPQGPSPQMPEQQEVPVMAGGSGFIIDQEGHIVTNNHVVENAEKIVVRLYDEQELEAEIVGTDPDTDLAVIKVDTNLRLEPLQWGPSKVKVGQYAIAVGSPRGLEGSFSYGHVTALGRENLRLPGLRFQNLIQTDAAINLGNSGGPLCDINGNVIGINNAIAYGATAIGFAIPVSTAKKVVPELITKGKVTRGFLGVKVRDVDEVVADALNLENTDGAFVEATQPGTPAAEAGVKAYDVIRQVEGQDIEDAQDLVNTVSDMAPGQTVDVKVWREGATETLQVTLGEFEQPSPPVQEAETPLGLQVSPLTPEIARRLGLEEGQTGVVISNVEPGGTAEEAGLRQGDVILEVAMKQVNDVDDFKRLLREHGKPGSAVLLRIKRGPAPPRTMGLRVPEE
jgi:Do/DeqQ family serine protease